MPSNRWIPVLAFGLVLGLGGNLLSCGEPSTTADHCWRAEGDLTCMEHYGADRPFCTVCEGVNENHGCVAERPATDECYSPCGAEQTILDDDSCLATTDDTTATADESSSGTDVDPCQSNGECPSEAPICSDTGECVTCPEVAEPDAACASLDPNAPVCDPGSSTCVQCLPDNVDACSGDTPLCDEATSSCVGCAWHEQCAEACRMKTGSCLVSNVWEVTTVEELQQAIDAIAMLAVPEGIIYLVEDIYGSATVPAGVRVAILGRPDDPAPYWQGSNLAALTVELGAEVYVQRVWITWTQSLGVGILLTGGQLWLDRSRVFRNRGGDLRINSGKAIVRNTFLGGDFDHTRVITVVDGQLTMSYSTVIAGTDDLGDPSALYCSNVAEVSVRNSILVSVSDSSEVVCDDATIDSSALEDVTAFPGNTMVDFVVTNWPNTGLAEGNFHLNGNHPTAIDTAAVWQPGDPLVDIDGDPRPQDQTPTAAGADLP